jgi:serine/threonine protein kinase
MTMLSAGMVLQNRYRIVALLGQGGMGAVYRAWDMRLNVPVALKEMTPQPGLDIQTLTQLREQFEQEANVLARLKHPHLVGVSDFFEESGNAYLVMEFVDGESLGERIADQGALSEGEVLAWADQLLDALAYCHSYGVIHRDIKPQNMVICPDGRAMLVDFGLVKLWDPNDPHTRTAMRGMGTPEYAPPEQYGIRPGHTDPRTDIYSVGATLYHALTGQAPLAAGDRMATPGQFVPVRGLNPAVSRGTEAAVLRAMELAVDDRFPTAQDMASALAGGAVPPQLVLPRGRVPVWAWAAGGVSGVAALILCVAMALGPLSGGAVPPLSPSVAPIATSSLPAPKPSPTPHSLPTLAVQDVLVLEGHTDHVVSVTWSPDGTQLASGGLNDHTVRVWDAPSGQQLQALEGHTRGVWSVAWSPDGAMLASGSSDGTVILWDAATGERLHTLEGHSGSVRGVAWSPDGTQLASGGLDDRTVRVWDAATGERLRTLEGDSGRVLSVVWSPDGTRLASGGDGILVWDAAGGELLDTLGESFMESVAWSPDGTQLAVGGNDARIWDATSGELLRTLDHWGYVFSVAWSPDGTQLASGSWGAVRVWDVASGQELRALEEHADNVRSVAWSPDGTRLASGGDDETVRVWVLAP